KTQETRPFDRVSWGEVLPGALRDAGQLAAVRHVAEPHARDAELAQHAAGTAVDRVAVAQPHGGRVARQLLQSEASGLAALVGAVGVDERLLQLEALRGVALHDGGALLVARDLALLGHAYRSSRNSTCLRTMGSYFLSTMRSGSLRRFFRVT